jgi:hypothetical protein
MPNIYHVTDEREAVGGEEGAGATSLRKAATAIESSSLSGFITDQVAFAAVFLRVFDCILLLSSGRPNLDASTYFTGYSPMKLLKSLKSVS